MSKDMKSIDTNLSKILKLEKEEQKFDEQVERERKRERDRDERNAKRKRADMFKKIKSDKKKSADTVNKTGNLFEKLSLDSVASLVARRICSEESEG